MDRRALRVFDQQAAADKEAKRLVKIAYATGGTVPYSLECMLRIKISMKVLRAVWREKN